MLILIVQYLDLVQRTQQLKKQKMGGKIWKHLVQKGTTLQSGAFTENPGCRAAGCRQF